MSAVGSKKRQTVVAGDIGPDPRVHVRPIRAFTFGRYVHLA
jgi:hypothetical protein